MTRLLLFCSGRRGLHRCFGDEGGVRRRRRLASAMPRGSSTAGASAMSRRGEVSALGLGERARRGAASRPVEACGCRLEVHRADPESGPEPHVQATAQPVMPIER
jgi:hypothetical protein